MEPVALYLVATPIGNRGDLSPRAQEILSSVDFIAAEDTRNSGTLLASFGIHKPMISYFDHNRRAHGEKILARLKAGETCALITDAGMPAVSDPGEDLVSDCIAQGLRVSIVPGPCAFVSALAVSGLPTRRFSFEGFLPTVKKDRKALLDELKTETRTLIFYEAPHRLKDTLAEFRDVFGGARRIACVRELTKIYEESIRSTLDEAVARYEATEPRGEFVLVLEGYTPEDVPPPSEDDLVALWQKKQEAGLSKSAAAKEIAKEFSLSKHEVYDLIKDL
ncbi:MAG: 16S rRNA (cytidine(1402)-2'-O)-methyltransferase [Clostridia bacterium]|nr:16S rRNA (cytidine(1402)-2'-O)-methyltransferase [Clostridia bacterium]MBQ5821470.1 16S rRNA (cytidine(1402)-2'-O)-methyltransferase [Clostridia bacterium]